MDIKNIDELLKTLRENNVYKFEVDNLAVEFFQGADPLNPIVKYNKEVNDSKDLIEPTRIGWERFNGN